MDKERVQKLAERLKIYEEKLEDDIDYEMSEEMQEEYFLLKEEFHELDSLMMNYDKSLKLTFNRLSEEYENPDSIKDSTLDMMFPESNREFDLDDMDFD
ncbi:hypothetical protein SAMN04488057_10434 [Cyclobacterium lianum]|uniref:Uncharacterized protein n=1 Tax=Cyclobacterium lianum TaxID=388280 RepID=A0A1M7M0D3_9BACT|nr:hypothetical protein [Cyclobacterium lianum]SHM84128.1 hypothetical protein SAMN04488057_10434 [Cyclobacterium lianum]